MKKWMKGMLIAGIVLLVVGIGITITAATVGGYTTGRRIAGYWIEEHIDTDTVGYVKDIIWHSTERDRDEKEYDSVEYTSVEDMTLFGTIQNAEELQKLSLSAEQTAVRIEEAEGLSGEIRIYIKEDANFRVQIEENSEEKEAEISFDYQRRRHNHGEAIVQIPAGSRFVQLDAEMNAGYMKLSGVKAENMNLESSAAELIAEQLEAGTLELTVKAASMTVSGTVSQSLETEVEAGAAVVSLGGTDNDYSYRVKNAVGSVRIGTDEYSGIANFGSNKNQSDSAYRSGGSSGAAKHIEVDCAAGSVEIDFRD